MKPRMPWALLAAALALVLSALRAWHLEDVIGGYTSCHGCYALPVLAHDGWLLALLFALLAYCSFAARRWLRVPVALAAAVLLVMFAADVELLQLFNQRFYLGDLLHFSGDPAAAWSVARAQFLSAGGYVHGVLAAAIVIVLVGLVAGACRAPRQAQALLALAAAAALFSAWGLRQTLRSVHGSYVLNVIEANRPPGRERTFSAAFAQHEQQLAAAEPQTCAAAAATPRNVVVVVVESLSAYQSALLGGPRDWLPRLDAVARANHYFTHFYANSFTTDGGEIALLTGRVPLIPDGQEWYTIAAFGGGPDTLPGVLHRAGGQSFYFTATDLSFLESGNWLRGLGFDGVEGNESPFYAGMPRTQFGAAGDAELFARFEHWLDERHDGRPFAAVLLTIGTHPPFVDPRSGAIDPAGSFGYVDEQLAAFHERLRNRGFLDDGILLITGDHRSMTPLLGDEYRRFGERAYARLPLIAAGAVDLPAVVDAPFQQSDLPASLARLYGVEYCRGAFTGTFLGAAESARYVVHARGDDRDRVDVYSGDGVSSYRLDGDASHWLGTPPAADAPMVAAWIDAQRIRNAPLHATTAR
jgi:hypothetical protein